MGYRRLSLLAIAAALALAGAQSQALADARIFTAKSSVPGITIDQAFRNGEELPIVGHGDGTTLFRIDSPSTPVGCANKIEFVASTGEHVEQLADMCALNWTVTVNVKAAAGGDNAAPPPAAGGEAVPAVPPADSSFAQTVTVSTDDPSATIIAVTLDGQPVAITGREGDAVKFEIAGTDQGIVCDRTVGLTLSDGREITRQANICLNNWTVVIAAGESGAPPPPTAELPTPPATETPAPPPAQPPVVQPPAAPNAEMVWMFSSAGNTATLVHGIPETEASNFSASCVRGSGNMTVTVLDSSVPGVVPGSAVPITFSAGSFARTYPGIGSPMDQIVGASLPEVQIPADPLWSAIIRETTLGVAIAPAWQSAISLAGSANPTRQLLAACSQAAVAPPVVAQPGPPAVGGGIVARFFCDNGEAITVTFNGAQQTAVLTEAGAPPLVLHWDPSRNTRYTSGAARLVLPSDGEARWSRFGGPPLTCLER